MAKIMVVEDDVTTNNLVSDYLTDAGHIIVSAYNGLEALDCFQHESIELIILDIMLPNADGIEVLREIRKTSSVPILMLTALSDERTQINSFDALADDYITKPFSNRPAGETCSCLAAPRRENGRKGYLEMRNYFSGL